MVVGHHTGAAVAIEVGASRPDLVRALVLSSATWTDAEFRLSHADGPGVDDAIPRPDGAHLMEERIGLVTAPVLMIGAAADPFAMPDLPRVSEALTGSALVETVVIEGWMIALMETHADEVAEAIDAFVDGLVRTTATA